MFVNNSMLGHLSCYLLSILLFCCVMKNKNINKLGLSCVKLKIAMLKLGPPTALLRFKGVSYKFHPARKTVTN